MSSKENKTRLVVETAIKLAKKKDGGTWERLVQDEYGDQLPKSWENNSQSQE